MSRKQYQQIANLLAANPEAQGIINGLCVILEADNPRFDRDRFIEACKKPQNPTTEKE